MKKIIAIIYFQIGVNVIGLPDIISHDLSSTIISNKSKYHK